MRCKNNVELGSVAIVKGGKRLPKGVNLIQIPNEHPYIRVRDIPNAKTIDLNSSFEYIDDETQKGISRYVVSQGDIVLSIVGSIGFVAVVGESLNGANLTENCVKLTEFDGIDRDFLYYYLISDYGQEEIAKGTVGAVQAKLPIKNIQKIKVPLFDIKEQQRIASVLSVLDAKIELNQRINDNLQQQAQAIYREMFVSNGSIATATIADVSLNVTDGVHNTVHDDPDGKCFLLSCKNIKGGHLSIGTNERTISEEVFSKLRRRTDLSKGDILISSVGTVGELLLLNTEPTNYEFQRSVAIVKPNPTIISSYYLYESLTYQKAELINAAHGAVQQCLFISDIAGFPIGVPEPEELLKFNSIIAPMFDTITANEATNATLCSIRDALLPRLISGEIDVSAIQL